jgi:hypothetical protein
MALLNVITTLKDILLRNKKRIYSFGDGFHVGQTNSTKQIKLQRRAVQIMEI